jgi:hypothetical protein
MMLMNELKNIFYVECNVIDEKNDYVRIKRVSEEDK